MLPAEQVAQLPHRDHATHSVSKYVLCFTHYESWKGFR